MAQALRWPRTVNQGQSLPVEIDRHNHPNKLTVRLTIPVLQRTCEWRVSSRASSLSEVLH
jgi:hypothetical protein